MDKKLTELLQDGISVEFIPVCGMETIYAYLDDATATYGFGKTAQSALDMVHAIYFQNKKTLTPNE